MSMCGGGEIPRTLAHQFEQKTGIRVNFSTYDSNETLFAKLKASPNPIYDVILPSSYYVERMKRQHMLSQLNPVNLPHLKNIDPLFTNQNYDPHNEYSIPMVWGATGIFYHKNLIKQPLEHWKDLWSSHLKNQLLLLDDAREIFAIGLLSLGFDPNTSNYDQIKLAFDSLLKLLPNIKLFASESIQATVIDEDALAGVIWNGDAYKAALENPAIRFVYPSEGFVIWVDCLAIPKGAPHPNEAYQFIDFLLEAESAVAIANEGNAITNAAGKGLLPIAMRNNQILYPSKSTLSHAYFQRDVGEQVVELYNNYWQQLKLH